MNYTCSNKVIKYLMLIFNFFFVITGIIVIGVGVSVKAHYYDYDIFLDNKYFTLPNMLIATGSLIFFISILGCFGAMRENWMMLMAFSVCLAIIFIFELSIGIAGYVLRDKTSSYLEGELLKSMPNYPSNPAISRMWDSIQSEFQCCGVTNSSDWFKTFDNYSLPVSCCPDNSGIVGVFYCNAFPVPTDAPTESTTAPTESTTVPKESTAATTELTTAPTEPTAAPTESTTATTESPPADENSAPLNKLGDNDEPTTAYPPSSSAPYGTGCETEFGNFVKKHAVDIGAVGIALAIIQLFGIGFSFHMARQLKNGYYST